MTILGLDPGTTESCLVAYDTEDSRVLSCEQLPNEVLLAQLETAKTDDCVLVAEYVQSMGMIVGQEVFDTVLWEGRFIQAWRGDWHLVSRRDVKLYLCGNMRAKDANVRTALLDMFGPGKDVAVGRKAEPGPLYGVSGHGWSALAVAVTWLDRKD